jgi:hypothetical protein
MNLARFKSLEELGTDETGLAEPSKTLLAFIILAYEGKFVIYP